MEAMCKESPWAKASSEVHPPTFGGCPGVALEHSSPMPPLTCLFNLCECLKRIYDWLLLYLCYAAKLVPHIIVMSLSQSGGHCRIRLKNYCSLNLNASGKQTELFHNISGFSWLIFLLRPCIISVRPLSCQNVAYLAKITQQDFEIKKELAASEIK